MKYTIYIRKEEPLVAQHILAAEPLVAQYILADGNKCFSGDVEFRPRTAGVFGNKTAKVSGPSFEFTDPDHARAFARSIFMAAERLEADIAAKTTVEGAV